MNKAVISFTHSNYCIRSAGTEKFVRNISKIIQEAGYSHLNFFSFYDDKKRMKRKMVGVNLDDEFQGVYLYDKIMDIINYFSKKNGLRYCSIHIQHLLHHDFDEISYIICSMKLPTFVIFHDYYLLCPKLKMIDSKREFCGVSAPNTEKCQYCNYGKDAIIHFGRVRKFFCEINEFVQYYVTPSDYVTENMIEIFPEFRNKFVTRPHVQVYGTYQRDNLDGKIRIAFAGAQYKEKGFDQWKCLVLELSKRCPDEYDFYYLGNGTQEVENVKNVFVSVAHQGDSAMIDHAKQYQIDCAFIWPELPETYSYVYYELSVCGIFILSNALSGNICRMIKKNKNGIVFKNYDDLLEWLSDHKKVKSEINQYRSRGVFKPQGFINNSKLELLLKDDVIYEGNGNYDKIGPSIIHTILYRIKHRKLLRKSERNEIRKKNITR